MKLDLPYEAVVEEIDALAIIWIVCALIAFAIFRNT